MAKIIVALGFSLLCAAIGAVVFGILWYFHYLVGGASDFAIYNYVVVGAIAGFLLGIFLFTQMLEHYID